MFNPKIVAFRSAETCVQRSPAHRRTDGSPPRYFFGRAQGVSTPRRPCLLTITSQCSSPWAEAATLSFDRRLAANKQKPPLTAHVNIVSAIEAEARGVSPVTRHLSARDVSPHPVAVACGVSPVTNRSEHFLMPDVVFLQICWCVPGDEVVCPFLPQ